MTDRKGSLATTIGRGPLLATDSSAWRTLTHSWSTVSADVVFRRESSPSVSVRVAAADEQLNNDVLRLLYFSRY